MVMRMIMRSATLNRAARPEATNRTRYKMGREQQDDDAVCERPNVREGEWREYAGGPGGFSGGAAPRYGLAASIDPRAMRVFRNVVPAAPAYGCQRANLSRPCIWWHLHQQGLGKFSDVVHGCKQS